MYRLLFVFLVGTALGAVPNRLSTPCIHGWSYFGHYCYKIVNLTLANSAPEVCKQLGGQLASIHSEQENKFIVDSGNQIQGTNFNYLIGFKGLSKTKPYTISWSDGTTGTFTNGVENVKPVWEPSNCHKVSGQGLSRYKWDIVSCSSLGMPVCKFDAYIGPIIPSRCGEGWTYFEKSNSCFKVLDKTKASAASKACEDIGSKLASILSEEENKFVVDQANKFPGTNFHYLIGFNKLSKSSPYRTEWIDGTTSDFTNGIEHFKEKLTESFCYKICGEGKSVFPWNEIDCSHVGLPICKKLAHKSK